MPRPDKTAKQVGDAEAMLRQLGPRAGMSKEEEYNAKYPAVACRLDRATADELQAIATANGVRLGVVVAEALVDFCRRYAAGEVTLGFDDEQTTRRVLRVRS